MSIGALCGCSRKRAYGKRVTAAPQTGDCITNVSVRPGDEVAGWKHRKPGSNRKRRILWRKGFGGPHQERCGRVAGDFAAELECQLAHGVIVGEHVGLDALDAGLDGDVEHRVPSRW